MFRMFRAEGKDWGVRAGDMKQPTCREMHTSGVPTLGSLAKWMFS